MSGLGWAPAPLRPPRPFLPNERHVSDLPFYRNPSQRHYPDPGALIQCHFCGPHWHHLDSCGTSSDLLGSIVPTRTLDAEARRRAGTSAAHSFSTELASPSCVVCGSGAGQIGLGVLQPVAPPAPRARQPDHVTLSRAPAISHNPLKYPVRRGQLVSVTSTPRYLAALVFNGTWIFLVWGTKTPHVISAARWPPRRCC